MNAKIENVKEQIEVIDKEKIEEEIKEIVIEFLRNTAIQAYKQNVKMFIYEEKKI
ncbi:MAG: hypothetical protein QXY70_01065 [Nanopusillaceae archaeon]